MKLLVVDDDTFVRMLFAFDLPEVELVEARGLREAADLLGDHEPDAIVVDRRLPDGDGLQLVRALRADDDNHVPIFLLTAAHDPGEEPDVLRTGVDVYMPKPFEAADLMARVHNVLSIVPEERREVRRSTASRLERGVA